MREPDCVMKIMASWMTIDELEVVRTRRDFIDSIWMKYTKQFTYRHPFGIHLRYIHQVPYCCSIPWSDRYRRECTFRHLIRVSYCMMGPAVDSMLLLPWLDHGFSIVLFTDVRICTSRSMCGAKKLICANRAASSKSLMVMFPLLLFTGDQSVLRLPGKCGAPDKPFTFWFSANIFHTATRGVCSTLPHQGKGVHFP